MNKTAAMRNKAGSITFEGLFFKVFYISKELVWDNECTDCIFLLVCC